MPSGVLTIEEAQKANLNIVTDGKGTQAVHDVVTALRANRRSGTACAKTRAEVSASGKKPWRQKGTGRARAGGNASPLWRGGGVVFGPRPRDYSKSVNKKTRRLAFRKALGARIAAGDVLVSADIRVTDGKTKSYASQIAAVTDARRTLVIGNFDEMTFRAARNHSQSLLMSPEEVNVEHLLYFDKIVITDGGLEPLSQRTA